MSLAYVPRDAVMVAAFRPTVLLQRPEFAEFKKLLSRRLESDKLVGFAPERIEQLTVAFMFEEKPIYKRARLAGRILSAIRTGGIATEPEPVAAIFRMTEADDAAALVKTLVPNPEECRYAGRTYLREKDGEPDAACVFTDELTVAVADEQHLRRLIVAGSDGASRARWAHSWSTAGQADALALVNIASIRSVAALKARELGTAVALNVNPPAAAPVFAAETGLISISLRDRATARFQLIAENADDAEKIRLAFNAVVHLLQAGLSALREEASSDAGDKGPAILRALDVLDGTLDSVAAQTNGVVFEASGQAGLDDVTRLVAGWVAAISDAEDDAPGRPVESGDGSDPGASSPGRAP